MPATNPVNIDGLLAALKASGTGEPKLKALRELAGRVDNFEDFAALANTVVSGGTLTKMEEYYTVNPPPACPVAPLKEAAKGADDNGDEEESPVSNENADEAIDAISRMRSLDKLQHIIDTDPRKTVQEAAFKRLEAITAG